MAVANAEDDSPGWTGKVNFEKIGARSARRAKARDKKPEGLLDFVSPDEWHDDDVPEREWYWEGLFPHAQVSILSAEGGTGKSLLALQTAVASALREDFLGLKLRPGKVVYFGAEDADDEFKRRLHDVARSHGVRRSEITDFKLVGRAGEDALLCAPHGKEGVRATPLWDKLVATVDYVKPVALFLDTAADVYGGDEIKRAQVRQFIGQLRKLAIEKDVAVILLYHPSQSGIESGKGTSGSTAWANSARAAVYMTRDGRKDDPDDDVRKLKTTKSNYGKFGDGLTVRWEKGVFVLDDPHRPPSVEAKAKQIRAERLFLERLDQHYAPVMRKRLTMSKSGSYAPRILLKMGPCEFTLRDFERAMDSLLAEGKIVVETIRHDGKDVKQLVRKWEGQRRYGDDE